MVMANSITHSTCIGTLMRLGKRAPNLSFNQDLMSLTNSAYGGRGSSGSDPLSSRFGKRAPALSINQDMQSLANQYRENTAGGSRNLLNRLGKRVPNLSVNADMQSLAEQYREQNGGRDGAAVQSLLNRLGKRAAPEVSVSQAIEALASMVSDTREEADKIAARRSQMSLYRLGKRSIFSAEDPQFYHYPLDY